MNLACIALKNLKKNFSFYSLYLFSVSFVLMIFFCFLSFSKNDIIMEKISSDGRVETMCSTVSIFIMAFVLFYMSYSNKFFMRRRMKELGIYTLLGYKKSSMLILLTLENIVICMGGLVIGILTGSLLHKGITYTIVKLLGLTINLHEIPFIKIEAVTFSLLFVFIVLLSLTISNSKLLWKATLLDLVRLEKKREKPIKVNKFFALIGIMLLLAGYALALDINRGAASLWTTIGFSPIALLTLVFVVLGTILFIYSFLPFFCNRIKSLKHLLYRENTIIVVPKFMHRIRSNAKSLILLILLSAGTIAILGSTVLSTWYPLAALERIIPSAAEFKITNRSEEKAVRAALKKTWDQKDYQIYETNICKVAATSDYLPIEYSISKNKGRTPGFECIRLTDYNTLLLNQNKTPADYQLSDQDCILLKYRPDPHKSDIGNTYTLKLNDGTTADVTVQDTTLQNSIGFGNSVGTLILSDHLYQRIRSASSDYTTVMSINGKDLRNHPLLYNTLQPILSNNIYFVCSYQRQTELIHENSSTLLLICFSTIIFLIATGSILYFQNISSVTYDKDDYVILSKMGYSTQLIKKIIRRQTQTYYLIPYILGLLHSIFALICYKSALMDDILGKTTAVLVPILFSLIIYTLIYFIYYQITKQSCYKIILK